MRILRRPDFKFSSSAISSIPCLSNGGEGVWESGEERPGQKCMVHFIELKKLLGIKATEIPLEGKPSQTHALALHLANS